MQYAPLAMPGTTPKPVKSDDQPSNTLEWLQKQLLGDQPPDSVDPDVSNLLKSLLGGGKNGTTL